MFGFKKKKVTEYDKIIEKAEKNLKKSEALNRRLSYSATNFMASTNAMIEMARK